MGTAGGAHDPDRIHGSTDLDPTTDPRLPACFRCASMAQGGGLRVEGSTSAALTALKPAGGVAKPFPADEAAAPPVASLSGSSAGPSEGRDVSPQPHAPSSSNGGAASVPPRTASLAHLRLLDRRFPVVTSILILLKLLDEYLVLQVRDVLLDMHARIRTDNVLTVMYIMS